MTDNYPLPPFVMLEMEEVWLDRIVRLALVDKKHNDVIDCNKYSIETFRFYNPEYVSTIIRAFKQELLNNGVI